MACRSSVQGTSRWTWADTESKSFTRLIFQVSSGETVGEGHGDRMEVSIRWTRLED